MEGEALAIGALAGVASFLLILAIAMWVLLIVAHWKMFTKAGEQGWKSLIPVYSDYTLFKLVWTTKSFWIYAGAILATVLLNMIGGHYTVVDGQVYFVNTGNILITSLSFIASFLVLAYAVILQIKTALAFGKGPGFAAGLLLLPNIFTLILAFGSAEYRGPQI